MSDATHRIDTQLVSLSRGDSSGRGYVNLPVHHASTFTYSSVADYTEALHTTQEYGAEKYARMGTEPVLELERAISRLEKGYAARATSSGLSAITTALLAFVEPGCDILIPESVYPTTRSFCDQFLNKELGIGVRYYDPRLADGIGALFKPETRVLFLESPGSYTFEIQDIPSLARQARTAGIVTIADNTWSGSVSSQPIDLGAEVSVSSLSKYVCGHADAMIGIVVANEDRFEKIRSTARFLGQNPAPDAVFLALRGLRTLSLRLERHKRNALTLAAWLEQRPEVARVYCPGLDSSPDQALWRRDFNGHAGLLSVQFRSAISKARVSHFIDNLALFRLGSSWGGFESLIIPVDGDGFGVDHPSQQGVFCRIHAGLEDPRELIADMECNLPGSD